MAAYYNEFDPYAAQWLRNLIKAGLIPAGDVDERSIEDVRPDDLRGYTQCHFFTGIGGWALFYKGTLTPVHGAGVVWGRDKPPSAIAVENMCDCRPLYVHP